MDEKDYAEFVRKYGEEVVLNGYEDFEKFAAKRNKDLNDLTQEKAKQDRNYANHNRDFGTNKRYDPEPSLKFKHQEHSIDEKEIAKKHGHKEAELDKDLTTAEKFAKAKEDFKGEKAAEPTTEEKLAEMKENFKEEASKAVNIPENKEQEKESAPAKEKIEESKDEKLQKFLEERRAMLERNKDRERER